MMTDIDSAHVGTSASGAKAKTVRAKADRAESEVVSGTEPSGRPDDRDRPPGGEMPVVVDGDDALAAADANAADDAATDEKWDEQRAFAASVEERLDAIEAEIETGFDSVLGMFRHKLAYDSSKDLQVDRLHEELQRHRADFVGKTIRGLVLGVISLHDQYARLATSLREKATEQLELHQLLRLLHGVPEDVVLLLEHHGVESYREELGERFDPERQRVVRTVPTGDREIGGTVTESVLPGFEQAGQVVERERVSVYKYDASLAEATVAEPLEAADDAADATESVEEAGGAALAAAIGSQEREG